jgi:Reverse transcriptase (RNA-dependent DNA polymerase)
MIDCFETLLKYVSKLQIDVASLFSTGFIKTIITSILCNLNSLLDAEMARGPEHAIKAVARPKVYYLLRGKFDMMNPIYTSGVYENPMKQIYVHILRLINSDQRFIKEVLKSLTPQEKISISSKSNINYHESTTRLSKGSNPYGNGGLILGCRSIAHSTTKVSQAKRSLSTKAASTYDDIIQISKFESGRDLLKELKVNKNGKFTGLYRLIYSKELILIAYNKLKSKSGNLTQGIDGETIDEMSMEKIDKILDSLKSETFQFTSVKRVLIPKNNGKLRPLGIPKFTDKLVQEAMRTLLEIIYEVKFSKLSHGFRPGRSCHTALREIST